MIRYGVIEFIQFNFFALACMTWKGKGIPFRSRGQERYNSSGGIMRMRRRQFLHSCAGSAAVAALCPAALFQKTRASSLVPVKALSLEMFQRLLGADFRVGTNRGLGLFLKLIEAKALPAKGYPDTFDEKFCLVFQGSVDYLLDQSTYSFEHPQIGEFRIFIVPILSRHAAGFFYQAVFNRTSHSPLKTRS